MFAESYYRYNTTGRGKTIFENEKIFDKSAQAAKTRLYQLNRNFFYAIHSEWVSDGSSDQSCI